MIRAIQRVGANPETREWIKLPLDGDVGVITGGGRGIGRAIALSLARRGMSVAVVSRSPEELNDTVSLIEGTGGRGAAYAADAGDRRSITAAVGAAERELGPIDLVVNAAGGISALGQIAELDPDVWWHDVEINLRTAFLTSWAALPGMLTRGRGRVINIISSSAQRPHGYGGSGYAAAKAGVLNLTSSLAAEGGSSRVRAFAIDPGTVRTQFTGRLSGSALWKRAFETRGRTPQWTPVERTARMCVVIALGRADWLSGRSIDVSDSLPHVGWRLLTTLGGLHRDFQAIRLRHFSSAPERVGAAATVMLTATALV